MASAIARTCGSYSDEVFRRHFINHVQKPLHAVAVRAAAVKPAGAVVAKGGSAPMPPLALHGLAGTMQRNLLRLERAGDEAEGEKARLGLAALSGQVSRAVEVAAKVSGVGAVDKTKDPLSIRIFIGAENQVFVGARMAHEADSADTLCRVQSQRVTKTQYVVVRVESLRRKAMRLCLLVLAPAVALALAGCTTSRVLEIGPGTFRVSAEAMTIPGAEEAAIGTAGNHCRGMGRQMASQGITTTPYRSYSNYASAVVTFQCVPVGSPPARGGAPDVVIEHRTQ